MKSAIFDYRLVPRLFVAVLTVYHLGYFRTTRININRININLNDYYNPVIDYYNQVIDYYNLLLKFEPCLNLLGLILILCKIDINLININININPT